MEDSLFPRRPIRRRLYVALVPLIVLFPLHVLSPFNSTREALPFSAHAAGAIDIWWPKDGSSYSGAVPLKAVVSGQPVDAYRMQWQVDGGALSSMETSLVDHPHKEAIISLSDWTWKGSGPYRVTFIATDNSGTRIAEKSIAISNSAPAPSASSIPAVTAPSPLPLSTTPTSSVSIWWPSNGVKLSGTQPLKAVLDGRNVDDYRMYWSVDGGARTLMPTITVDHPHKEALANTSAWNWNSTGTYTITFSATDLSGTTIGEKNVTVSTAATVQTAVAPTSTVASSTNPFAGKRFYVNPYSNAKRQIELWKSSRPSDAKELEKIANQPDAEWFGDWNGDIEGAVATYATTTTSQGATPVMVAYNIPQRDCGSYSAGGAGSAESYRSWIRSFARGIGNKQAVVILEPDALPGLGCLSAPDQDARLSLLKDAVETLKANVKTAVYIDAGHSNWISVDETARRLGKAGIAGADGFSLNISNFIATDQNIAFGTSVAQKIGGKHFIIDTSRNGNGSNGEWCNPSGRALGSAPTSATGNGLVDAFFWIKRPGDSDGSCNGAPSAGTWMPEYALELSRNAR